MKRRFAAAIAALVLLLAGVAIGSVSPAFAVPTTNCMPKLTTCGYPTLATAGLDPTAPALTPVTSYMDTTANDQVIENLDITGCIIVHHTGVIVRNVKIHGDCFYGIIVDSGSVTITRSEVSCDDGLDSGIGFDNWSADAIYVHDCENGVLMENNSTLTNSVITGWENGPLSHGDLVQYFAGSNTVLTGNLLVATNPMTSAFIADGGGVDNVVISNNFFGGGAYTAYCAELPVTNWSITGNRFYPLAETPDLDRRSPHWGMTSACDTSGITWSGNYVDSTGATLNANGTVS